jgi:hypothetical protein
MTKRDDQPTHDLRNLDSGQETPGTVKTQELEAQDAKAGGEISNVDLQFMGHRDGQRDQEARIDAQNKAPGEYEERGMDKQDVASAGSMIASDPASTTPGEETSEDTDDQTR